MRKHAEDDGILRAGYQNMNGTYMDSGLDIAWKIEAMEKLGTDKQEYLEVNRPWNANNKWKY